MFDEMDSDDISSILAEHYSSPVTSTDMTKFDFKVSNTKKKKKKKTRFQAATPSIDKYQPSTLSLKRIRKQRSHSVGNDDDCNANKIKIKESDTGIYDDDGKEGYSSSNSSKKRSKKKKKTNDVNDQFTGLVFVHMYKSVCLGFVFFICMYLMADVQIQCLLSLFA